MRFSFDTGTVAILLLSITLVLAHPWSITDIQLVTREAEPLDTRYGSFFEGVKDLWKRKGGGGGGGKGGGSSSSSGKGGSSSSSSSSSSSGYVPSSP